MLVLSIIIALELSSCKYVPYVCSIFQIFRFADVLSMPKS
jgi:hypothetical protein